MQPQQAEWIWLDDAGTVSPDELALACGLSPADVEELVDYGALVPVVQSRDGRLFHATCVAPMREAARLRIDFDLDLFAVALLLGYLERIESLQARVRALEARAPAPA